MRWASIAHCCIFLMLRRCAIFAVMCKHSTSLCRLHTCQRQVCGAASGERVLPADALAAHEHPHLRPLHATDHSLGLSTRLHGACEQGVSRAAGRVPAGLLAGWLAGVLTPLLEICPVQDYCIRPGTSCTVSVLS
jgi:hypothetical protein